MPTNNLKIALIIPTLNAERDNWKNILQAINEQSLKPNFKLILDSASSDKTVAFADKAGFEIHHVKPGTFDHAGTRAWGIDLVKNRADIVIFMTQDALLSNKNSFINLIKGYSDELVAATYGRQLPSDNATPIETFGRLFNYPKNSNTRSLVDKNIFGMKVAFCSDSYASYRLKTILKTKAFPNKSIVGEDYITVARLLLNGFKVRYEARAMVKHSHNYSLKEEFKRYFDIGVFHNEYKQTIRQLGATEKVGGRYVKAEFKFLIYNHPLKVPLSLLRNISKYIGYKVGSLHEKIHTKIKVKLSMHSFYFMVKK